MAVAAPWSRRDEPSPPRPLETGSSAGPGGSGRALAAGVLALVVAVGVVLRFVCDSPLWLDEALSVNIARLPLGDLPEALRHDGHPPLYYALLHGWIEVFGTGDVAVRALSGVLSLMLLPLAWLAARRRAGPAAGWAVVVLLAVNPYAVRYATEARMYALVMVLVVVLALLALDRAPQLAPWRFAALAVTSGALVLSHYWAVWLLVAAGGLLALHRRWRHLLAIGVGALALVPWLGVLVYQARHTGTPWSGPARPTRVVGDTLVDFGGGRYPEGQLLAMLLVLLVALGLFARSAARTVELDLRTVPTARWEAIVVGATIVVGAAAGLVGGTTFHTRYAAVVFPLFVVVAAVGLVRLPAGVPQLLVAAGAVALGLAGSVLNAVEDRTQAADIAAAIRADAGEDDVVVFCPDQLGPAVSRLLPATLSQVVYPTMASPARVDWVDYASRNAAADPARFIADVDARFGTMGSVWLVLSPGYRTYEGRCEALAAALGEVRGGAASVVGEDVEFYEHAGLLRFAPTP